MRNLRETKRQKVVLTALFSVLCSPRVDATVEQELKHREVELMGCSWLIPSYFELTSAKNSDTWSSPLRQEIEKNVTFYRIPMDPPLDLPHLEEMGEIADLRNAYSAGYSIANFQIGTMSVFQIQGRGMTLDLFAFNEEEFRNFSSPCFPSEGLIGQD